MAEGGGEKEGAWWNNSDDFETGTDEPDTVTRTQVGDQSRVLINHFITQRVTRERPGQRLTEAELFEPGTPTGGAVVGPQYVQIANSLQEIGDQLDTDTRLQALINRLPTDCQREAFMDVARNIFADGQFNWGRVVMLFYLAYKMATRALDRVPIIRRVVEWVVDFIKRFVANWIISRGGWSAIQEYFGSTTGQALGVFLAGIISAYFAYRKYR